MKLFLYDYTLKNQPPLFIYLKILHMYTRFETMFKSMGKRKIGPPPTSNLLVNCLEGRFGVARFGTSHVIRQDPHPQGAKQVKAYHRNAEVVFRV